MVFDSKGVTLKYSRINELGCQRALKTVLGPFRGPSGLADTPRNCPKQERLSHGAGGMSVMVVKGDGDEGAGRRIEAIRNPIRFGFG